MGGWEMVKLMMMWEKTREKKKKKVDEKGVKNGNN